MRVVKAKVPRVRRLLTHPGLCLFTTFYAQQSIGSDLPFNFVLPQQRTPLIEFPCPPLRFVYLLFICLWTGFYELWPDVCLMSLYGLHLNWPMRTDLKIILLIVIWLWHWWLTFSSAYFSTLLVCLFVMLNLVKKQFYLPQKNIEIIGQCWQSDQMWTIWTWWE